MGWSRGSELLRGIVMSTKIVVPKKHRKELYKLFINQFEAHDCDTCAEAEGIDSEFDKAIRELYPEYDNEYDEE